MSELQDAESADIELDDGFELDQEEIEETEGEESEQSEADLATDSPDEGEENTESGQEAVQKAINRQHRKFREEERKRQEIEKELERAREQLQKFQPTDVVIPPVPDPFDDDYDQKIRARDEAIQRKAEQDARKSSDAEREAQAQRERQRQELERSQKLNDSFLSNAKKLKVDERGLQSAQEVIIEYGVSPQIATTILEDADGPLIALHLAENLLELDDLVNADPFKAGMKWRDVKAKVSAKRKSSVAPKPATRLEGRGAPEKEEGPDGATYE